MSVKELHGRAWRLIYAAKVAGSPERRKLLMDEAFELVKQASDLHRREIEDAPTSARPYRLWLFNFSGATLSVDLQIESKADALWATEALSAACAEEYDDYELWQGTTLLSFGQTGHSVFCAQTAMEINVATQLSVLEALEAMCRSRTNLARSQRLLDLTGEMRKWCDSPKVN